MNKTEAERIVTLETIIPTICDDIHDIRHNHLEHIERDLRQMTTNMVELKTDMSWLKRFFWVIAGASVSSLVATLLSFVIGR